MDRGSFFHNLILNLEFDLDCFGDIGQSVSLETPKYIIKVCTDMKDDVYLYVNGKSEQITDFDAAYDKICGLIEEK